MSVATPVRHAPPSVLRKPDVRLHSALRLWQRNASIYRSRLPAARVSVIARVGYDVAASCGMFFGPGGPVADGSRDGRVDPCSQ